MAKLYRDHRCDECGADVPADLKMVNFLHDQHCSLHPSNVVEIDFKRLEPPGARAKCPVCLRDGVRASAFEDEDGWPWAVHWECREQYEYRWARRRGREAKRAKAEEKAKRDAQKPPTPPKPTSEAAARRLRPMRQPFVVMAATPTVRAEAAPAHATAAWPNGVHAGPRLHPRQA
jgi:hypothetical protein